MPGMVAGFLVARPVDDAAEPVEQVSPGGLALVAGVAGVACRSSAGRRRPWRSRGGSGRSLRAACGRSGRRSARCRTGRAAARPSSSIDHRGDLAELDRALAIGGQRLAAAGQGVEGVAPFVEQGPHVAVEADGVHEDERQPVVLERRLVAAGGLPLAVGQVEQLLRAQEGELLAELGVDVAEDRLGARGELLDVVERLERRPAQRVDRRGPTGGATRRPARLRCSSWICRASGTTTCSTASWNRIASATP